jgi:hypothetical protein
MANQVSVYVYRQNQNDLFNQNGTPATAGVLFSFPTNAIQVTASAVVANGVQMNSVIDFYPNGLNQPSTKFYSNATVAGLVAAINGSGIQTTTTTTAAPTTTTTTAA